MLTTHDKIITISNRGQITIPNKLRQALPVKHFTGQVVKGKLILNPLKTRDQFLAELEQDEQAWKKKGGVPFEEVMKKSHKLS